MISHCKIPFCLYNLFITWSCIRKTFNYQFPTCTPKSSNQSAYVLDSFLIGRFLSTSMKFGIECYMIVRPDCIFFDYAT